MPDFGPDAAFIWANYAIVAGGSFALSLVLWLRLKSAKALLNRLQDETDQQT